MLYNIHGRLTQVRIAIEIRAKESNILDRIVYCDPQKLDNELKLINRELWKIGRITIADNYGREYDIAEGA